MTDMEFDINSFQGGLEKYSLKKKTEALQSCFCSHMKENSTLSIFPVFMKINSNTNVAAASGPDDGCRAADSDNARRVSAWSCSNDVSVCFPTDVTQMCQRVTNTLPAFEEFQPKKEQWPSREPVEMKGDPVCLHCVVTSQPKMKSKSGSDSLPPVSCSTLPSAA